MTELQKCEFNILREVLAVCDKLNIQYFLVCGTALGAVKYNGFIPWDDDIDIGMFREDYERFVNEAKDFLPKHLFVQNFRTDPGFAQIYTKVRDSRTTYIEKSVADIRMHHGVYIDVFPLDGYPDKKDEQIKFEKKKRLYKLICESGYDFKRSPKAEIFVKILRVLGVVKRVHKTLKKYENMISDYGTEDSKIICNHGNYQGKLEYAPIEQYGDGVMMTFEGLNVRVPKMYNEYLTQKYGDWRSDLPKEQRVGHHYYTVCDLTKPYTEYIS